MFDGPKRCVDCDYFRVDDALPRYPQYDNAPKERAHCIRTITCAKNWEIPDYVLKENGRPPWCPHNHFRKWDGGWGMGNIDYLDYLMTDEEHYWYIKNTVCGECTELSAACYKYCKENYGKPYKDWGSLMNLYDDSPLDKQAVEEFYYKWRACVYAPATNKPTKEQMDEYRKSRPTVSNAVRRGDKGKIL